MKQRNVPSVWNLWKTVLLPQLAMKAHDALICDESAKNGCIEHALVYRSLHLRLYVNLRTSFYALCQSTVGRAQEVT